MCYNCGCGSPNDPMGKGKLKDGGASLTDDDFTHMADVWNMTSEEAKSNTFKLLQKQLEGKKNQ